MIIPLFAAAMYCPTPQLIDKTKLPWTEQDQATLLNVQKEGCRRNDPNEPCLIIFEKVEENTYSVICGPERPRE